MACIWKITNQNVYVIHLLLLPSILWVQSEDGIPEVLFCPCHYKTTLKSTKSCAALQAADLDWIVGPGYSWGRCIWGGLNVSLRASSTQLRLDLTCFVIHHLSCVVWHPLSVLRLTGGFPLTGSDGGSQLTGSDDFSSMTEDPKWLKVMIFRHWRGIPADLLDV